MAFRYQPQQQQHQHRSQTLTQKLRAYSARHVKIYRTVDMARAKAIITEIVEKEILRYCWEKSSLPILRLECRGSMYEGLKTEAADEADLMVVINASEAEVGIVQAGVPGYAFLRAGSSNLLHSPFRQVCSWRRQGYISPDAIHYTWFKNLVSNAVYDFQRRFPTSQYKLSVVDHGPAVKLDIYWKLWPIDPLLSVDLVPCFHIAGRYYVPKRYDGRKMVLNRDLLWKQSFALQEKQMLQYMDREDHGCRHELLRIVKAIVKNDIFLRFPLSSYHVKHAFLHYMATPRIWNGENSLGDNFLGFMSSMCVFFMKGSIPHFWEPHFNILESMPNPLHACLVAYRCAEIVNSEDVRNAVLNDQHHDI